MTVKNPFADPDVAPKYDSWYHTKGKKAAEKEKALISTFTGRYSNARTILEVGCGTGYFTRWFEEMGLRAVGLDSSWQMIQEAQQRHPIFYVQGDGLALPFTTRSFDLVTLITSLEFFEKPEQALKEALRVARCGLILGVINKNSLIGFRYKRKGGPIWSRARLFSPGELVSMLKALLPKNSSITVRTTLWPIFSGSSNLPWGGFIGVDVRL